MSERHLTFWKSPAVSHVGTNWRLTSVRSRKCFCLKKPLANVADHDLKGDLLIINRKKLISQDNPLLLWHRARVFSTDSEQCPPMKRAEDWNEYKVFFRWLALTSITFTCIYLYRHLVREIKLETKNLKKFCREVKENHSFGPNAVLQGLLGYTGY